MPSSRCDHLPTVLSIVRALQPQSILDIGVGFGKWGHLFREYTDIIASEEEPERYQRDRWCVRIDGIEGYEPYITPGHRFYYNNLYIGDMRQKIHEVGSYDIIFAGDVIEHLEMPDGVAFIQHCLKHAGKAVILTTPAKDTGQQSLCANELETHRSLWGIQDFQAIAPCTAKVVDNDILVAVFLASGVNTPRARFFRPPPSLWKRIRKALRG